MPDSPRKLEQMVRACWEPGSARRPQSGGSIRPRRRCANGRALRRRRREWVAGRSSRPLSSPARTPPATRSSSSVTYREASRCGCHDTLICFAHGTPLHRSSAQTLLEQRSRSFIRRYQQHAHRLAASGQQRVPVIHPRQFVAEIGPVSTQSVYVRPGSGRRDETSYDARVRPLSECFGVGTPGRRALAKPARLRPLFENCPVVIQQWFAMAAAFPSAIARCPASGRSKHYGESGNERNRYVTNV
jgi:hypothetical protein